MSDGRVATWRQLPRGIWVLGLVSLFMDISSEMIHALLPVFLVTGLGASTLALGLIEGAAEAVASVVKVFSGVISDRMRSRKRLVTLGYALAALTKPAFALANSVGVVVAARMTDRVGKGIRGAPRDALIADIAPERLRGASFGLRQSLDTVGAFIGPALAIGLMAITANSFRTVFWIAAIPAAIAVGLLVLAVREPERAPQPRATRSLVADAKRLDAAFWTVVALAGVLTLARFSEAFLILRANMLGLGIAFVPIILVIMNVAYAASAYPAGVLADRVGRWGVLAVSMVLLIGADLVIAGSRTVPMMLVGVVLWGLHMGFSQGIFAALIADTAPFDLRGSAFGVFNLVVGVALLASSVMAGALWGRFGPAVTFLAGAGFTAVALIGVAGLWATGRGGRTLAR